RACARYALRDRTGKADVPAPRARDLDVRRERVEAVGPVRADGNRVSRIRVERLRLQAIGLRQQDGPRLAGTHQARIRVARQRDRAAAVPAVDADERRQRGAIVGFRVARPDRCLIRIAEQRTQETGLHAGPPGDASRWRDVVPISLVAFRALLQLDELRNAAAARPRLEHVALAVEAAVAEP